ncbi:hypothetical protein ACSVBT_13045 [Afipia sp. TerB]
MTSRFAANLTLAAALVLPQAMVAVAAEQKPDIAIKTKAVEIKVTLDSVIRKNAALAANLLADSKRWAERNRANADEEYKASPEFFRDGRTWTFERDYKVQSIVADRYVSVLRTMFIYTGGAHPNTDLDTILWDDLAKKPISIRPFFKDLADNGPALTAMRRAIIVSLKAEKKERGIDDPDESWTSGVEAKLLRIGAVELAPSTEAGKSAGLIFNYSPYAVGPYVEGSYQAFVPWDVLKPYLTPEGTAIFGGRRPAETEPPRK